MRTTEEIAEDVINRSYGIGSIDWMETKSAMKNYAIEILEEVSKELKREWKVSESTANRIVNNIKEKIK